MAADEVHELAVRLSPEGERETTQALQNTGDEFERTADTAEESSMELSRFSRRFTGALAVAGGVLGGIAAGFLSQVPAIQETAAGLGAVIDSLALKFDEEFGPAIRDANSELFTLANRISEADSFDEAIDIVVDFTIREGRELFDWIGEMMGQEGPIEGFVEGNAPDWLQDILLSDIETWPSNIPGVSNADLPELPNVDVSDLNPFGTAGASVPPNPPSIGPRPAFERPRTPSAGGGRTFEQLSQQFERFAREQTKINRKFATTTTTTAETERRERTRPRFEDPTRDDPGTTTTRRGI